MPELTLTDDEIGKLIGIAEPTQIRNAEGNVIGVFSPVRQLDELDRQMLERIRQRRGKNERTYTTKEVLDHLKQLETNS